MVTDFLTQDGAMFVDSEEHSASTTVSHRRKRFRGLAPTSPARANLELLGLRLTAINPITECCCVGHTASLRVRRAASRASDTRTHVLRVVPRASNRHGGTRPEPPVASRTQTRLMPTPSMLTGDGWRRSWRGLWALLM